MRGVAHEVIPGDDGGEIKKEERERERAGKKKEKKR